MSKTLTVAVPSYNVEKYLEASLTSYIAEGADERLEVIVIDDGSTDATAAIASGFCERFPGIFKLVSQANGGHGAAVNTGMAHATGKYFRIIIMICVSMRNKYPIKFCRIESELI